jgi:hypothetical protein
VSPARLRAVTLLVLLALAGLALLAWSQTWFALELPDESLAAGGDVAAGALAPLALSALLLVPALAIAGPFFRVVLGVLQIALGGCVALQAQLSIADPVAASARAVSDATGIEGERVGDLVASATPTAWPVVALVAGLLMALAGVGVVATARRWPVSTRKYQAVRFEDATPDRADAVAAEAGGADADADTPEQPGRRGEARRGRVDDWDALSGGDDPTRR